MSTKIEDLTSRLEQKKNTLAKEIEQRDKKNETIKKLEQDLKILEAELVTAHLTANNMTLEDLTALLGEQVKETAYVSGE